MTYSALGLSFQTAVNITLLAGILTLAFKSLIASPEESFINSLALNVFPFSSFKSTDGFQPTNSDPTFVGCSTVGITCSKYTSLVGMEDPPSVSKFTS